MNFDNKLWTFYNISNCSNMRVNIIIYYPSPLLPFLKVKQVMILFTMILSIFKFNIWWVKELCHEHFELDITDMKNTGKNKNKKYAHTTQKKDNILMSDLSLLSLAQLASALINAAVQMLPTALHFESHQGWIKKNSTMIPCHCKKTLVDENKNAEKVFHICA